MKRRLVAHIYQTKDKRDCCTFSLPRSIYIYTCIPFLRFRVHIIHTQTRRLSRCNRNGGGGPREKKKNRLRNRFFAVWTRSRTWSPTVVSLSLSCMSIHGKEGFFKSRTEKIKTVFYVFGVCVWVVKSIVLDF